MKIRDKEIGAEHRCYLIAEIGINHNGDVRTALRLIDTAARAGFDAVKFQKREPELCVPRDQWDATRETPWGHLRYIDYKRKMELSREDYIQIARHANAAGLHWFASCWDLPSLEMIDALNPDAHKIASACITDTELVRAIERTLRPAIMSTGMSTPDQIESAVGALSRPRLALLHTTSAYPCAERDINLRAMTTLAARYPDIPVGYSGHERGLQVSLAAAALGARIIERHVTLDRTMWGTDHAASLEPRGMELLVRDVHLIEQALGDGIKRIYDSESEPMARLRRYQ